MGIHPLARPARTAAQLVALLLSGGCGSPAGDGDDAGPGSDSESSSEGASDHSESADPSETDSDSEDSSDDSEESSDGTDELLYISHPSQVFREAFDLVLDTVQDEAELRFTLDGTMPTEASPEWEDTMTVETSTRLRVAVYLDDVAVARQSRVYVAAAPTLRSRAGITDPVSGVARV